MRHATPSRAPRGFTLIETMISLAVLSIGMVGMMQLQVYGVYADQGARANIRALELGRELSNAMLRIDPLDSRFTPDFTAVTAPSAFGNPLDPSTASYWHAFGTSDSLPGVTPTAQIERDPLNPSQPLYTRQWSVWQVTTANTASAVRLVAVSVVYHEQHFPRARSVTLYVQVANPGAAAVNAAAYR